MKWGKISLIAILGALAAGCGPDEDYLRTSAVQNPIVVEEHQPKLSNFNHYWLPEGDCTNKADGESCSDDVWCNGLETCLDEVCRVGAAPCNGPCDEDHNHCAAECVTDEDCDDGIFCTGEEFCCTRANTDLGCEKYRCYRDVLGPCGDPFWAPLAICDTTLDSCRGCYTDNECDDDKYCTGVEVCTPGYPSQGTCSHVYETIPCKEENLLCDEENDRCMPRYDCEYDYQCDDHKWCNGSEWCGIYNKCEASNNDPCNWMADFECDEQNDVCIPQ